MRSVRSVLKRFRSRTPVTVLTPLGVVWIGGIVTSTSTDLYRSSGGVGSWVFFGLILLVAAYAVLSFLDRLFRMRSADASWGMFGSLTFFTALTSAGPISLLFGNPNHDYPAAATCVLIAPTMAFLAVREFRWLRASRRYRRLAPAS